VALVACSPPAGPKAEATWKVVLHDLEPALLCIWGTRQDDVYAVGGPRGNGTPSAFLHYDGSGWRDLSPGGTETFWWAHGTSSTDVWAVGDEGRITHWDGRAFTEYPSGTKATLYGVWATSKMDAWAVGGTPEGGAGQPNDVLLHFDGTTWSPSPLPRTLGRAFFKVWGTPSSGGATLYVVGELGTIWHRVGANWSLEAASPPLATGNLTTVSGCSDTDVYAVGGEDVLRWNGKSWSRLNVDLENAVTGVACAAAGDAVIVGFGGLKQRLTQGRWQSDFAYDPHQYLHGAWADPSGAFWAAGGDYASDPMPGVGRAGLVGYFGAATPSSATEP
jgi:hypothetical protein